jgi:hypothetical protein
MASEIVANCPRCNANQMTFDVRADVMVDAGKVSAGLSKPAFEAFSVCRSCNLPTVFRLRRRHASGDDWYSGHLTAVKRTLTGFLDVEGYLSLKDFSTLKPPDHLPEEVKSAFVEGATCVSVRCFNAAGTMFRLCVDLTTKAKLPSDDANGLNHRVRRDLGLRLPWLFENGLLPDDLRDLSHCIKEDGNDGAHGGTLTEADALDLLDFTAALLDRVYTQPARLKMATARRLERRNTA